MRLSRSGAVIAAAVAATIGAGAIAVGAIPSGDGTIRACVKQAVKGEASSQGAVRFVDAEAGVTCVAGERTVTLNQRGQPGANGATGATGATGSDGATGPSNAALLDSGDTLPVGLYTISTAVLVTTTAAVTDGNCALDLKGGTTESRSQGFFLDVPANGHASGVILSQVTVSGPTKLGVSCASGLTIRSASHLVTKVGALHL